MQIIYVIFSRLKETTIHRTIQKEIDTTRSCLLSLKTMIPVVSIVGRSGSGKTTLLEKVVGELTKRGYRVGTIKHDVHGFEIDHEGKDSWRHKRAGAMTVVLSSGEKFAVIKDVDVEWKPECLVSAFLSDMDIVITEGYKRAGFPKIEVIRKARSTKPVCTKTKDLLAIVSDIKIRSSIPRFDLNDFKGVVDLLEERFLSGRERRKLSLFVDNREIPLKPFIEGLLVDGIAGMIKNLKDCADPSRIEIRIDLRA